MEDSDIHDQIPQNDRARPNNLVNAKEFASKFRSKREVYNFLTIDVKAYLPGYETLNLYFLRDLVNGQKKCKCHRPLNH